MRDPLPSAVQARPARGRAALALAASLLLALAACHAIERPSYLAFRAGKLLGVDLERGGAIPVDALFDSRNRHHAGVASAIVAHTTVHDADYLRVWFAATAQAESAELFFASKGKGPRRVVAALWTPRFAERKGWRAEAEQLGVKLAQIEGFSPDFGAIFATQAPELHALLAVDAREPQGRLAGLLRTSDLAGFLAARGALLPFATVRDRVERALTHGELKAALADRALLAAVVTGEASALLARLDEASNAASGARAATGLASLGTAEVPPLAQELVSLARAGASAAGAELVVARANAVVGLAQRWASSSGRRTGILDGGRSLGLRAKFSLYKEARALGRTKLEARADAATARFVAALQRELVELTGHAASRAEVAERPATAAAMRLLVAGLRAPEGATGPEPAALQAVQALLAPLFAKLVPAPDPAATTTELVRPAYEADLGADWPYFTRAGAARPKLADHVATGRAEGNPPLEIVVDSGSLDVSQVSFTKMDTYATTPPVMGTERNPERGKWDQWRFRLDNWNRAIQARREQERKEREGPRPLTPVRRERPSKVYMPDPSLKSMKEVAADEADEAAYEAAWKAYVASEPPRELPVVVRPGRRYDVQQQRWVGTATRLVKVRGGRGEEVLRQTFDLGAAPSLQFDRIAKDFSHPNQWVWPRDDWKDLAYIKAQLPRLMDDALGAWLRPAFAELLTRQRLAAIDAHTRNAGERGWLKFFFGASTADERTRLDPVEPGADPVFTGAPAALAVGAKWRPRAPAAVAVAVAVAEAEEERLLPLQRAPMSLDWHPSGERFVLTRDEAVEVRLPNGALHRTLVVPQSGQLHARHTLDGARIEAYDAQTRDRAKIWIWSFEGNEGAASLGRRPVTTAPPGASSDPPCVFRAGSFLCSRSGRIARLTRFEAVTSAALELNGGTPVGNGSRERGAPVVSRDGLAVLTSPTRVFKAFSAQGTLRVHVERPDGDAPVPLGTGELPLATHFQFTPDGRHVLGADTNAGGNVSVWDAGTGALVREYAPPRPGLRPSAVALSPDGTTLVIGYYVPDGQSGLLRVLRRANAP